MVTNLNGSSSWHVVHQGQLSETACIVALAHLIVNVNNLLFFVTDVEAK
jgi:hypothetical protein